MTLDDLERKNKFYGFFGDFGLRDTFQERIAPKSLKIDRDSLRVKLLALGPKRSFDLFKFRPPPAFKEFSVRGRQT